MYTSSSLGYIKNYLDPSLQDMLLTACFNLSAILGDDGGKITKSTMQRLTDTTLVVAPGRLVLNDGMSLDSNDRYYITSEVLSLDLSVRGFVVYGQFKDKDSGVLADLNSFNSEERSPLLSLTSGYPPSLRSVINVLFCELFGLYQELIFSSPTRGLNTITRSELDRVITNMRWLSSKMEYLPKVDYDLIEVIRDIQKVVMYVRSQTSLFELSYKAKMQDLTNM